MASRNLVIIATLAVILSIAILEVSTAPELGPAVLLEADKLYDEAPRGRVRVRRDGYDCTSKCLKLGGGRKGGRCTSVSGVFFSVTCGAWGVTCVCHY